MNVVCFRVSGTAEGSHGCDCKACFLSNRHAEYIDVEVCVPADTRDLEEYAIERALEEWENRNVYYDHAEWVEGPVVVRCAIDVQLRRNDMQTLPGMEE